MTHGTHARTALRLLAGIALSATAVAATGLFDGAAGGAATAGYSRAVKVSAPANADHNPGAALYGLSCTSAGNCTAVGEYSDGSNHQQALAAVETGGKWVARSEVSAPSNAAKDPDASLHVVSCSSKGNCSAVGEYTDRSNHQQALAAVESGGKWSRAEEVHTSPIAALNGLSCTAAASCVAVGSDGSLGHAIVVTETAGKWGEAVDLSLPGNAGTGSEAFALLQAVSCKSKGDCTAVGLYGGPTGERYAMIATESGGKWARAVELSKLPSGASGSWADLLGVSCVTASSCTAVGSYEDNSGDDWPMVAVESAGTWGTASKSSLPKGANTGSGGPSAELDAVSCPSVGNCAAFGAYTDTSYYSHDMVLTESHGKWARSAQLLPPSGAGGEDVLLGGVGDTVACVTRSCTAVGGYTDASGNEQAMAASGTI